MGKKYMVVMTNGDSYTLSGLDFVRVQTAMQENKAVVQVTDTANNLELTLLVANISVAVERGGQNA